MVGAHLKKVINFSVPNSVNIPFGICGSLVSTLLKEDGTLQHHICVTVIITSPSFNSFLKMR
jgi:hypothetical protein